MSNELEILRCSKPNSNHLSLTLLQKCVFDLLYGSLIASAGLSLYGAFDYLTFAESLDEAQSKQVPSNARFSFALEGNCELAIVLFACFQTCILVSVAIYNGLRKAHKPHIWIINFSFALVFCSFILLCFVETSKRETPERIQLLDIHIPVLMVAEALMALGFGLGSHAIKKQIGQVLGSDEILMSWSSNSAAHGWVGGDAKTHQESYREGYMARYLKY